jgi:hypothetical protein
MSTDWKALCAELVLQMDAMDDSRHWDDSLYERACAALAQPEPQGATDEELDTFFQQWRDVNTDAESWLTDEQERRLARDLFARYGLAQSEPQGVRQEAVLDWLRNDEAWGTIVAPKSWRAQDDKLLNLLLRAIAHFGRAAIKPVPVAERLPEPHTKVIAHYLNDLGNSRTILAEWVPAKSRTDDCLVDDDFAEYDEEADEYYWPEGWYESIENWDDYGAVFVHEGMITHWQPLPRGPHYALPVSQQQEVK